MSPVFIGEGSFSMHDGISMTRDRQAAKLDGPEEGAWRSVAGYRQKRARLTFMDGRPGLPQGSCSMWESHTSQLLKDGETLRSFFECCLVYGGGPCTFVDPWKQGFSAPSLNGAETQLIVARRN